jgi:predicted lysophospholipase L1 biosynthesis ABC-type transport system permease subunit
MKPIQEYEQDIASIRAMMERSAKFISLSGLSGVLAGIYALAGATAAYFTVHYPISPMHYRIASVQTPEALFKLIAIAAVVLAASILTGVWLSQKKAKKYGLKLWTPTSRTLLTNMIVPLAAGGVFILIMLFTGHFGLAAPACLIFYGLALIQASANTYQEIRYLGFCEIVLGLVSALMPGYGLVFWAVGFGVLHIVYGAIMHNKYDT